MKKTNSSVYHIFTRIVLLAMFCAGNIQAKGQIKLPVSWASDPPNLDVLISFSKTESEMRVVVRRFTEDFASLKRRYTIAYSPVRRARLEKFFGDWDKSIDNIKFNALTQEAKIDYILLKNTIKYESNRLQTEKSTWNKFKDMVPFSDSLRILQENRFDKKSLDQRRTAKMLSGVVDQIDNIMSQLAGNKSANPSATNSLLAVDYINKLLVVTDDWNTFYDGYDPLYNFWTRESYARARTSLVKYRDLIKQKTEEGSPKDFEPIIGVPIFEKGLDADLVHEMIPYSINELLAIGEREFNWTIERLKEVSREMGYGDDWKKAHEYVKTLAPPPGEIIPALYNIAAYSFKYVDNLKYITLPPLELEIWRMRMRTPAEQLTAPFFLGGEYTSASYPTDEMDFKSKMMSMRGNTPSFNFPTVQHELIPGHYQQSFVNDRFNVDRSDLFHTPFWLEGNAFYWELLLWDKGNFARSNADKIGMLFWRLHRAGRIMFTLNFHLGNWSPQDCVNFMVEKEGHERANAEAEVRGGLRSAFRGMATPLYQLSYEIGALQNRALYKEVVESGKMTPTEFHDAILIGGNMPFEMVRARLLNLPLSKDYKSNWRWEGDVLK